jgi:hypothetical protein
MTRPLALLSFFGVAARSAAQDATSAGVTVLPPDTEVGVPAHLDEFARFQKLI